ncbi:hypothetical protein K1719_002704 [Acacia pycnantha]|nr:hypothetical protein K1719_002704 [Acacia pycnantha]
MSDALEIAHKGTPGIKENHVNTLMTKYDLLRMKSGKLKFRKGLDEIGSKNKGIALKIVKEDKESYGDDDEDEDEELGMMFRKKAYVSAIWGDNSSDKDEADEEERANVCLMAQEESESEEVCLRVSKSNKWYIDSGCSRHMTRDQSKFATIKPKNGGNMTFGGNQSGRIAGIGEVGSNDEPQIKDVYLVEGICHNLLSVSQSTDKGNLVIFNSKECLIVSKDDLPLDNVKSKALFRAPRDDNCYTLSLLSNSSENCFIGNMDESWL